MLPCQGRFSGRRDFLRTSASATAAVLAGHSLLRAAPAGPAVVIVRDKTQKSIVGDNVDAAIVQKLVDEAVMKLAGKDDIAKAWATYVSPKDKVAIKFNGLFARATTHPEVVAAVTNGLVKAGVNPANIVIFDRHDKDLKTANITPNREGDGPRAFATEKDYGPSVKAGPVDTQLTNILLKADVLINLPIMKTHVLAGVSGALKNHLGTVPNANAFHRDTCQFVADISALGPVKDKTRICLCDALYGLFDKGPQFNAACRFDYHGIIASVDPVAMDAVLAEILKAKRIEKGLAPYHKDIKHVERGAELGIGVADLAKINRVEAEV
ncbi:MAG TPA: DUF362 domain-containing protein [Planctomycetota bacterium]|nr:DUF362 domain-containing protein [Planctomycetota bacterium]HRR82475.1 DUF362 domain-containing protein [Planctomycetota bacterium]HRT97797.1 DUF362 domain-containing protein [Planctomycetota bacterium]